MEKSLAILGAVFLVLSLADITSAVPFRFRNFINFQNDCPDDEETRELETNDGTDEPAVQINNYVMQFFLTQASLRASNCTSLFLEQTVSPHLCNSNSIKFQFPQGSTLNDSERFLQQICFDPAANGLGEILGSDIVLYKRSTPQESPFAFEELQVFITETVHVEDFEFEQLLSYRRIVREATGWQVFHLGKRINYGLETQRFCINVLVRVQANGITTLLNRTSIQAAFVLERSNQQPIRALYIYKATDTTSTPPFIPSTDPFPFFKRSLPQQLSVEPSGRSSECSVQEHIVNLSDVLQRNVLIPKTANLGKCSDEQVKVEMGGTIKTSGEKQPSRVCQPTVLDDLVVVHSDEHGSISVDTIPNAIVKNCGYIP